MNSLKTESIGTCLHCGYELVVSDAPDCSECGRHFDLHDRSTFARKQLLKWRKFAHPPTLFWAILPALVTGCWLYESSLPRRPHGYFMLSLTIMGLLWLRRFGFWLADRKRARNDPVSLHARPLWRWMVLPFCVLIVTSTLFWNWPFEIRWRSSKQAILDYINMMDQPGQANIQCPGWIGWYKFDNVIFDGHGNARLEIYDRWRGVYGFDKIRNPSMECFRLHGLRLPTRLTEIDDDWRYFSFDRMYEICAECP